MKRILASLKFKKLFKSFVVSFLILNFYIFLPIASSGNTSDALNANLRKQTDLQNKIKNAQTQEKTLSDQLSVMDDQISLLNLQLEQTSTQIDQLTAQIADTQNKLAQTETELTQKTKLAQDRIKEIYERGGNKTLDIFLSGGSFNNFLTLQKYNEVVHDQEVKLITSLQEAKTSFQAQKEELANEQEQAQTLASQLTSQKNDLTNQQNQKGSLLSSTKNSEASYQTQLAAAKAEEKTLLAFANARVGSGGSILPHSDLADSWGKYYNQRDSYWGNIYIGGSDLTVWEVGCLITSVAMVFSHYGYNDMTPGMIAANSANFWGNSASLLIPGPVPPGHSANYVYNPSSSYLSSQVSAGNAVIIGMDLGGGQTHWVVVRGTNGSGGFMINDPWYQNSMNVSLSTHYGSAYIFAARVYN